MSDGNFNRNLLPYNNYQSGLRAGMARTKAKAMEELTKILQQYTDTLLTEGTKSEIITELHKRLP